MYALEFQTTAGSKPHCNLVNFFSTTNKAVYVKEITAIEWCPPSAGKRVRASHDWFWFYSPLVEKVARVLFPLYLNNIGENIKAQIGLFEDNAVLYGVIKNVHDAESLQQDLNTLVNWAVK